MATQYEILLQKQLQEPHPLDTYGEGLVNLARTQAQQRFQQEYAAQAQAARMEDIKATEEIRLKTAEIQAKAADARAREKDTFDLTRLYKQKGIAKNPNESDEDYVVRAAGEYNKQLGGHLDATAQAAESSNAKLSAATAAAATNYRQRLRDNTWRILQPQLADLIDAKTIKDLQSATPVMRDEKLGQLLGDAKFKKLASSYSFAEDQALKATPQFTGEEQINIDALKRAAQSAESNRDTLLRDPRYSGAIPFTKAFSGETPREYDFSKPKAPGEVAPVPGAGAKKTMPPPPATPSEIYGGGNYGYGPAQEQPLMGDIYGGLRSTGEAIDRSMPAGLATPLLAGFDLVTAGANRLIGTPTGSTLEWARRNARSPEFYADQPGRDAGFVGAYLQGMGLPRTMNPPQHGLPPTQAEIMAFRNAMAPKAFPLTPGDQTFVPQPVPRAPMQIPPELLATPQNYAAAYQSGGLGAIALNATRTASPAEIALSESAHAAELRKRIARHPKAESYPAQPLRDKLSTLSLPELQTLYRQLGPEDVGAPSEIGP